MGFTNWTVDIKPTIHVAAYLDSTRKLAASRCRQLTKKQMEGAKPLLKRPQRQLKPKPGCKRLVHAPNTAEKPEQQPMFKGERATEGPYSGPNGKSRGVDSGNGGPTYPSWNHGDPGEQVEC